MEYNVNGTLLAEVDLPTYRCEKTMALATVHTLGNQPDHSLTESIAVNHHPGGDIHHYVYPPHGIDREGFQTVISGSIDPHCSSHHADGIMIEDGVTVVMSSKDCPMVYMENCLNGKRVLLHAGRPALTPGCTIGRCGDIISIGLNKVAARTTDTSQVFAYITGDICGHCFVHDASETARALVTPFFEVYGSSVFHNPKRGGLSLQAVIRQALVGRGVPADNISHYGHCTKEHPGMASHRNGDINTNQVLVIANT